MNTITFTDTPIISTRIPEGRKVRGLTYGAHVSKNGWCGYCVRPTRRHDGKWAIAQLTPASDELPGTGSDRAILAAIRDEFTTLPQNTAVQTAERYVSAVEHEAERTRLYNNLVAAEIANGLAQRAAEDAAYALRIARESIEDFEAQQ